MNQKGFSLIELMVVVAIIGILSAVAVPQFQKFQRKAKQSEAKANLSALYTNQKVFLSEHNTYYDNIVALGYLPEGSYNYYIGSRLNGEATSVVRPPAIPATAYSAAGGMPTNWTLCQFTYATKNSADSSNYGLNCQVPVVCPSASRPSTSVTASAFTMGACAMLGGATNDAWTISHRKEIINTLNGAL